ncbi:hypothetical protein [Nitriliruptor alkaliphilus]|uniref:hypothetical protein n=1 Tax=Nitriliruptor alkaliphilus TaxID=427918 RepID=UPI0006963494|nr:hypothetical protein [Nitriliruptor alkaliphilus]
MIDRRQVTGEEGAIPFVAIGVVALAGTLGVAWAGNEWSQNLLGQAGGELTVWVLRGAFWALDLVAVQAATEPVNRDWYTPVLEGPALPLLTLAMLVAVGTLLAEVIAGMLQGNAVRIVQAVFRAIVAGMLATVGAGVLLAVGGALSGVGRLALEASGTTVDAPLVPLQEVLMETAQAGEGGAELFVTFLAALVIVFTSLYIYFLLAMRPVLLAAIIVILPIAHALSVWTPMRRVQVRVWSLAFAVLVADAAVLTMFAVTNTAMGQPEGVDRLIFGTFGLLLAALAPAALARVVGAPELQTAVQSMSGGSKLLALGAGALAAKGAVSAAAGSVSRARAKNGASALEGAAPGGPSSGGLPGDGPNGGGPAGGGRGGGPGGRGGSSRGGRSASSGLAAAGAAPASAGAGARSGSGPSSSAGGAGQQQNSNPATSPSSAAQVPTGGGALTGSGAGATASSPPASHAVSSTSDTTPVPTAGGWQSAVTRPAAEPSRV